MPVEERRAPPQQNNDMNSFLHEVPPEFLVEGLQMLMLHDFMQQLNSLVTPSLAYFCSASGSEDSWATCSLTQRALLSSRGGAHYIGRASDSRPCSRTSRARKSPTARAREAVEGGLKAWRQAGLCGGRDG